MKFIISVLALSLAVNSYGQDNRLAVHPGIIVSAGVLGGEAEPAPVAQLSTGLAFGRYYAGAGIGLDQYRFRSMPLFADLRVGLGRTQSLFLYGNAGHNFSREKGDAANNFLIRDKYFGGFYMDAGAGYRFALGRWSCLLFSAGYSRKNMRNEQTTRTWCFTGDCPDIHTTYQYKMGRIAIKLSLELGR